MLLNQFAWPVAMDKIGWHTYIIFCGWCGVQAIVIYFFIPETKNRTVCPSLPSPSKTKSLTKSPTARRTRRNLQLATPSLGIYSAKTPRLRCLWRCCKYPGDIAYTRSLIEFFVCCFTFTFECFIPGCLRTVPLFSCGGKERKGREKLGMITYIRIFRRNVCNVLLPLGKEDFLMGALGVFGVGVLVGEGRILQG